MDQARARALLAGERARLQRLLQGDDEEGDEAVGLMPAGHP
jgi:hypothetical protein